MHTLTGGMRPSTSAPPLTPPTHHVQVRPSALIHTTLLSPADGQIIRAHRVHMYTCPHASSHTHMHAACMCMPTHRQLEVIEDRGII